MVLSFFLNFVLHLYLPTWKFHLSNFSVEKFDFWKTRLGYTFIAASSIFIIFYCVIILTHSENFMCLIWVV